MAILYRRALLRAAGYASLATGGQEAMATQMVEYASSLRKKGEPGRVEAMQVLEHGLSFMKGSSSTALCRIELAIATFHADRGKLSEASEALRAVAETSLASLEDRVSALEALAGVQLQLHQDESAAKQAQAMWELGSAEEDATSLAAYQARSSALAGLVQIAGARYDDAESCFANLPQSVDDQGSVLLGRAEFYHVRGKATEARQLYEDAIKLAKEAQPGGRSLAPTVSAEEVHAAASAGLGQLCTGLGDYAAAEKSLTEALRIVESISGEAHIRVGPVLSCMADLYSRRAKAEGTGFMIPEGLFRRSLELMKAPSMTKEQVQDAFPFVDVVALTRARYGDILSLADQRKAEGSRLSSWAAAAWKSRKPLPEALGESAYPLIEVRFGRVF